MKLKNKKITEATMKKNEIREKLVILDELRDEISEKLDEVEGILSEVVREINPMILDRAEAYWLGHIRSSLFKDRGNPYDVSMGDSLNELREEIGEAPSES